MTGQQTCPLILHFNTWTVSSDVSIQRRHWQLLSVHLWAYCTHPTHDVNDVMSEGWPQHRGVRPLFFSNSSVGSSHKSHISVSAVRRDLRFFVRLESLTVCRCNYKGSTFLSVIWRPWVLVRPGFEPVTSRSADMRSPSWASHAAVMMQMQTQIKRNKHGTHKHALGLLSLSVLYHVFARKQCIFCSALRHKMVPYITIIMLHRFEIFFCPWNYRTRLH